MGEVPRQANCLEDMQDSSLGSVLQDRPIANAVSPQERLILLAMPGVLENWAALVLLRQPTVVVARLLTRLRVGVDQYTPRLLTRLYALPLSTTKELGHLLPSGDKTWHKFRIAHRATLRSLAQIRTTFT